MNIKMIPCIKCKKDMPELRLTQYGYKVCVNCSTVGSKRGIPVMRGTGDHTWTETIIMEEDQYEQFVIATAKERGEKNASKIEMLDTDNFERNLQGPFTIINSPNKIKN